MKNVEKLLSPYEKKEIKAKLKEEYMDALKDEDFKLLVSKLNVSEDILMKYTSLLEDSKCEYHNCLHCKNLLECKNKVEGHAYLPDFKDSSIHFIYKPCKFLLKHQKERAHLDNITFLHVKENQQIASFKDIYLKDASRIKAIEKVTQFMMDYKEGKNPKGIYLHGSFGSGKTYLLTALVNELAKLGVKSCIAFFSEYLNDLKSSFSNPEEFREKLEVVKKTDILFIDDLGAENVTPWSRDDVLCPILQYRMDTNLPTFITSNFTLEELETHLSISKNGVDIVKAKRIIERIKQLCEPVALESKNLRK